MFLSFTRKISRRHIGLVVALTMLFAPALLGTPAASAQRKNAKAAPTPKKNAKPTPDKKASSKNAAAKNNDSKSKTNAKPNRETASKDKRTSKKDDKSSRRNDKIPPRAAKSDKKNDDRNKRSDSRRSNSKQALAERNRNSDRSAKSKKETERKDDRRTTRSAANNRRAQNAPVIAKTPVKKTTRANYAADPPVGTTVVRNDAAETVLPQIIVTASSVPVRSQASASAAPVSNVRLGTILRVTDKNPAWYKVEWSKDGKTGAGWISANAVDDLNAAQKEEIYRQIVERNYRPEMDFDSSVELYEFLDTASGDLAASESAADLELKRLFALRSALRKVPVGRGGAAPFRQFLAAHERAVVYNEPAGEWLVASNEFWNLHKKYQKSGAADSIAWEAANNPLPGECEGYVNCYLFDMRMRFGEYLNLHPAGRHSAEALKNLTDYLAPIVADLPQKSIYNGPTDVTDRAEFNNLIAELRTIVSRLNYTEKEKALQQLRQIAEAYR